MYTELIIDLSKNPLNKRIIDNATATNSGANLTCGDHARMYVQLKDDTVTDCSFEGEGCAISMATASMLTEHAKGKKISEISSWNQQTVFEFLETEIGATRIKCALLPLEILLGALSRA